MNEEKILETIKKIKNWVHQPRWVGIPPSFESAQTLLGSILEEAKGDFFLPADLLLDYDVLFIFIYQEIRFRDQEERLIALEQTLYGVGHAIADSPFRRKER